MNAHKINSKKQLITSFLKGNNEFKMNVGILKGVLFCVFLFSLSSVYASVDVGVGKNGVIIQTPNSISGGNGTTNNYYNNTYINITQSVGLPINLSNASVTGVLPTANGGTNKNTWTTNSLVYSLGTSNLGNVARVNNAMLVSGSAGAPFWNDTLFSSLMRLLNSTTSGGNNETYLNQTFLRLDTLNTGDFNMPSYGNLSLHANGEPFAIWKENGTISTNFGELPVRSYELRRNGTVPFGFYNADLGILLPNARANIFNYETEYGVDIFSGIVGEVNNGSKTGMFQLGANSEDLINYHGYLQLGSGNDIYNPSAGGELSIFGDSGGNKVFLVDYLNNYDVSVGNSLLPYKTNLKVLNGNLSVSDCFTLNGVTTCDLNSLGNSSWNQSGAKIYFDGLYYSKTNPSSYWNASSNGFNKTYADTIYYPLNSNPNNYINVSSNGNPFDQSLNKSDSVLFNNLNVTYDEQVGQNLIVVNRIEVGERNGYGVANKLGVYSDISDTGEHRTGMVFHFNISDGDETPNQVIRGMQFSSEGNYTDGNEIRMIDMPMNIVGNGTNKKIALDTSMGGASGMNVGWDVSIRDALLPFGNRVMNVADGYLHIAPTLETPKHISGNLDLFVYNGIESWDGVYITNQKGGIAYSRPALNLYANNTLGKDMISGYSIDGSATSKTFSVDTYGNTNITNNLSVGDSIFTKDLNFRKNNTEVYYGKLTTEGLTATRTYTFQDQSGTIPMLGSSNTWSNTNLFNGALNIGTNRNITGNGNNYIRGSFTLNITGNIQSNSLAGTGNAYACLDSTGKLYRSAVACI